MDILYWFDLAGVAVFAVSGALVASRNQMDLVGFGLIATVTGIGGGTLRDLLLDRPVFWIQQPVYIVLCVVVATALFFIAPHIQRRFKVLLWADALGLALFATLGAGIAHGHGAGPVVAIVMGIMTATFGGLIRDVLCNEIPLILRKEIYATAAALGAAVFSGMIHVGLSLEAAQLGGFAVGFLLRALGLVFGLSLPAYGTREKRHYPIE